MRRPKPKAGMRLRPVNAGIIVLALSLVGCMGDGAPGPHGPSRSLTPEEVIEESLATWQVTDGSAVNGDDTKLAIGVTRLGCANGETGEISDVDVQLGDDQVAVRARVEPPPGSAYNCLGNDMVEVQVDLGEPIGDRMLVDGACEHPRAATTSACDTDVRWPLSRDDGPPAGS